jgi:hypothetical protein
MKTISPIETNRLGRKNADYFGKSLPSKPLRLSFLTCVTQTYVFTSPGFAQHCRVHDSRPAVTFAPQAASASTIAI